MRLPPSVFLALLASGPLYSQSYVITTVAGGGLPVNIPGTSANLSSGPQSVAADAAGNVFFAYENVILRLDAATGTLTLAAGNGTQGNGGDNGPATSAQLSSPSGVALDSAGNLYIADAGNAIIRKVTNGIIATVAGSRVEGFAGDNGPATSAQLSGAYGVAVDSAGKLYIADTGNSRIRMVANGVITTVAGNGSPGFSGDNGPATSAQLNGASAVAVDSAGNLYIVDNQNWRVRKVSNGVITTVVGNGTMGFGGDGGPATSAQLNYPTGIAVDSAGNLYISDTGGSEGPDRIRKVTNGTISTVAGGGTQFGDNGPATSAQLNFPYGVAVDSAGNFYINDSDDFRIRKVVSGVISTVAGGGSYDGVNGAATSGLLDGPVGIAVDAAGNLYIADEGDSLVRKVSNGVIATVAGNGTAGFSGDNGPATSAELNGPFWVAVDSAGNLYIADLQNDRVRMVANGMITTVAGNGTYAFGGDNGPATSAELASPTAVAVDSAGSLYIADGNNSRIRKVTNGVITTVAGNGTPSFSGDNGLATSAGLDAPYGIAVDSAGNLFIADAANNRIRKVANGIITTVAGNGVQGFSGDNGPATNAQLSFPTGVAVDSAGNLFIADVYNSRIRKVANGVITTIAGGGTQFGDNGPATNAQLSGPSAVAVDSAGNIYISDGEDNRIRLLTPAPGLGITKTHTGSFTQGQQGATYTVTVSNAAGSLSTSGTVTVTETVPNGLTLVSMSGPGWSCSSNTCTRGDVLNPGANYPAITVTVNVSANAGSPLVNSVSVAGGGSGGASATDSTVVNPIAILCTPSQFTFTYAIGGSQPPNQTCSLTSSPSGLNVAATSNQSWLAVTPTSGATPGTLTIIVSAVGLNVGAYNGLVLIAGSGQTFAMPVNLTVTTAATFTLTPNSASAPATASTGTTSLSLAPAGSNAVWSTASTAIWLHVTSPASGTGSGAATIGYSVDANNGTERIGTFNVSSGGVVVATFTVDQAAAGCSSLSISPTSFTFGSAGGTGVLNFNTAPCPWTASTNNTTLITGLPTSGNTGTITFGVSGGATASSATITIPSTVPPTTIDVTRTGPVCTYTIATGGAIGTTQGFLAGGGTGSVNVTAPAGCSWTAAAISPFLSVTSGAAGSGSGSVNYSVSSNPSSTTSRSGTLTVAGITYTINQTPQGPQSYTCTANVGVPSTVRAEGIAELVGDIVVTCNGVSSGSVTGDVLVTLNTSITNHTLNADTSGQTTDALLLKDGPSSSSLTLTGAGQNAYRGSIAGPLAVRFKNVSLAPETGSFSHIFRITNLRVDASHLGGASVTAAVSILSTAPFTIGNASQTVGFSLASSSFSLGSSSPASGGQTQPITFSEQFATAYRVKLASGQDPSTGGTVYNSESGYVNTSVLGSDTGFATNGTRLVARFTNIPAGTLVYVPVTQASGSASAQLISADTTGAGGSPMQGSAQVPGYQPVALLNGAGSATWEITASSPTTIDSLTFNLLLSNTSLALQSSCTAGSLPSVCGALGPQVAVAAPSNTAPVPRFVNPTVTAPSQVTKLNIAPNPATAPSGSASPNKPQVARLASSGGSGNTVTVGGTVTIGELLQSDVNSPLVNGVCVGTTLPPSYTITACSGGSGSTCTQTGSNQVSTCYTAIDPGQSSTISVTADTTDTSGSAELDASVVSNSGNFGAGSFSEIVTVAPGPSVMLSFQGPSGIPAGKTITYTVSLNNTGAAKLAGDPMIVTLAPDASLTGILAPLPGVGDPAWTCTPAGATIVCANTSAVAAGGQSSFEVTANVPLGEAGGVISTAATLTLGGQVSARQPVNTSVGPGVPGAVTLLSPANGATGVSTSPSLTWSAATGAASYTVNFGTSNPPPLVFNTPGLTYSPAALTSGTTYYWQITATNSSGSTPSAVWSFTAGPPPGFRFVPVTPCRVMDTRGATGTFGGPAIAGGSTRNVPIPQSACGIPSTAQAYSLNITVVPPAPLTYLTIWPAGQSQPVVSTLNSLDGRIVANAAIVPAGASGAISVFVSNTTNVIIDIDGYFAPASTAGSMSFYSATPCRVVDTRSANGAFGGPFLSGASTRSFAIPSSSCGIPATAQAYSLNVTVAPHGPLQYLTTWPAGQSQPVVSTLNSLDGSIVANAAIVPAGTGGAVSVFVTNDTDVIIDINGYFAPPGSTGALSLYTLTPCRIADTRGATGPFGGPSLAGNSTRSFTIPSSSCSVPSAAQAYSLNVTVVPPAALTYLTAWPTGQSQPVVSTLNSLAGKIVSNAAIVPAGGSGAVSIFVSNPTDVILDVNAYFAQ